MGTQYCPNCGHKVGASPLTYLWATLAVVAILLIIVGGHYEQEMYELRKELEQVQSADDGYSGDIADWEYEYLEGEYQDLKDKYISLLDEYDYAQNKLYEYEHYFEQQGYNPLY